MKSRNQLFFKGSFRIIISGPRCRTLILIIKSHIRNQKWWLLNWYHFLSFLKISIIASRSNSNFFHCSSKTITIWTKCIFLIPSNSRRYCWHCRSTLIVAWTRGWILEEIVLIHSIIHLYIHILNLKCLLHS